MNFFLLLNTKEDILNYMGNQTVSGPHWLPWYFFWKPWYVFEKRNDE